MKKLLAAVVTAGALILTPAPAHSKTHAASSACSVVAPSRRADGSYDLLMSSTMRGNVFHFTVTTHSGGFPFETVVRTYRYHNVPRSYHTGRLTGTPVRVTGYASVLACAKWGR